MDLLRRKLIKSLSIIPFAPKLVPLSTQTSSQPTKSQSPVPASLALNVVRFFNIIELTYKLKFGSYATIDQLFDATSVSWFVNPRTATKQGMGQEFFRALRPGDEEIVAGWKLSIVKPSDDLAYSLALRRTDESVAIGRCSDICVD